MANKIMTRYINPPIPWRGCDWRAYVDGDEEGYCGYGATEEEAIKNLKGWLEDESA
jgi:hypothetical protein